MGVVLVRPLLTKKKTTGRMHNIIFWRDKSGT